MPAPAVIRVTAPNISDIITTTDDSFTQAGSAAIAIPKLDLAISTHQL
jgi:hypothetical protein